MNAPGKKHVVMLLCMLILISTCLGIGVQRSVLALDAVEDSMKTLKVLIHILVKIQDNYVNPDKVSTDSLIKGAIHGMVGTLDRYSVFMEPDDAKEFSDQTQGSFGGLGIQIDVVDGWLTVIEPLPNTPAAKAGLMSGDKIVEIDGENTKGLSIYKAIKMLKGDPDTTVTLTIARRSETELREVPLTRAIIKTNAVAQNEKRMLDKSIGYVRLRDFTRDAADELDSAIRDLEKQGMQGLILDLRDNVGGLLDVAVRICDLFIEKGQKIVSHRDRDNYEKVYYAETAPVGRFQMAVLVNEFSASASEIVAGCIQDHKRGILVGPEGHRTFGKGSVQTLYELKDMPGMEGASLKLTTAKYFTPLGRSIEDEKGLAPDIYAQVTDDQRHDIRVAGKTGYIPPSMLGAPTVESATETVQAKNPATVAEVFSSQEESETKAQQENLYDIELLTAYQCLKGIMLLQTSGGGK